MTPSDEIIDDAHKVASQRFGQPAQRQLPRPQPVLPRQFPDRAQRAAAHHDVPDVGRCRVVEVGAGSPVHAVAPSTAPTTTNPQVRTRTLARAPVAGTALPPGKLRMRSVPSV